MIIDYLVFNRKQDLGQSRIDSVQPTKCRYCRAVFASKEFLIQHVNRTHAERTAGMSGSDDLEMILTSLV
jgi:hypothetical protein